MEKRYLVTKKKVLKSQEPGTFITNQTWIDGNKKFMKIHGMTYEPIEEKEELKEETIPQKKEKPKKIKTEEVGKTDESQESEE